MEFALGQNFPKWITQNTQPSRCSLKQEFVAHTRFYGQTSLKYCMPSDLLRYRQHALVC